MRILMTGLLLLALPAVLGAQIDGVVVDGSGQPVEGAAVELWRPMERAAVRLTGADGAFRFRDEESAGAVALYATRLGFAPLRVAVAPGAAGVRLVLTEAGVPLPELVVETAGRVCPNREDEAAAALWRAASAGYVALEEQTFVQTRLATAMGRVEIGDVGARPARATGRGERGSAGSMHVEWRARIRGEGYAWPINAVFAPRGAGAPSYLLPIEGWYWRETSFPGRFVQHWQKYEAWEVERR